MKTNTVIVFVVFVACFITDCAGLNGKHQWKTFKASKEDNIMDVSDFSVFYDLNTNETIRRMMPRPWYKPGWLLRLPFNGGKCKCEGLQCSCCIGIRINSLNFDRSTCTLLTYKQEEAMIGVEIKMQNVTAFKREYSVANPPPLCVPIPVTPLPPGFFDMCFRLFDVSLINSKLHVCMDIDTRVDTAPVLVLHFDCMDMGLDGVGLSKPGGSTGTGSIGSTGSTDTSSINTGSSPIESPEPVQVDFDVYDPVTEKIPTTEPPFPNSVKYI